MAKHLVFVYGTLKRGQPNCRRFGDLAEGSFQFEGVGETVDRYALIVASSMHIPFVLAQKGTGEHVRGELYSVDDAQLACLDRLEGHPRNYKRTTISVRVVAEAEELQAGSVVGAECYLLYDFLPELLGQPCLKAYDALALGPDRRYVAPADRPKEARPYEEIKVKRGQ